MATLHRIPAFVEASHDVHDRAGPTTPWRGYGALVHTSPT